MDQPMLCVRSVACKIIFANWVIVGNGFDEFNDMADGSSDLGCECWML